MQDLVHDHKEVVAAPLGIACNKLSHDRINLLYDVHSQQLLKFNFTRCNYSSDDLKRSRVELSMADLEILEQDLDEPKLLQDENESRVALNNDGEQFEAE